MKQPLRLIIFLFLITGLLIPVYSQNYKIDSLKLNSENYYPLYKILNILHLERHYDYYTQKLIIKDKGRYLIFFPEEDTIYCERQSILLKSSPIRVKGVIYIPKQMVDLLTQWKKNDFLFSYVDNNFKIDKKQEIIYKKETQVVQKKLIKKKHSEKNIPVKYNKQPQIFASSPNKIQVIIIDPGHGGKDPGAIGQKGLREKGVVLNVGLYLKTYLNKKLRNIKVVMTRDTDKFIPLNKRADIANKYLKKNSTGIFISIHANASMNKRSQGTETFVLSPIASDDEARAVAAMENGIISTKKRKIEPVTKILSGMLSYENIRESIQLAKFIQAGYKKNLKTKPRQKQIKKALFYVLEGTLMPGVLTEIGFITNKKEERFLRSKAYQKNIAQSIGEGTLKFIKWYEANNGFIQ